MTSINGNFQELVSIAFHIRKLDSNDKYTSKLINGQVQPEVIEKIIQHSKWDEAKQCMVPS